MIFLFPLGFQPINVLEQIRANRAPHRVKNKINAFPTCQLCRRNEVADLVLILRRQFLKDSREFFVLAAALRDGGFYVLLSTRCSRREMHISNEVL